MALTHTRSDASAPQGTAAPPAPAGLAGALGSGDHKTVGRLFIGTALATLLGSLMLGELLAIDQLDPGTHKVLTDNNFFQILTLHTTSVVFLGLIPLLLGLALVVVPLQIGSRAVAFPRAAAAAYWLYLLGGALYVASYATNGGPGGGTSRSVDLWSASLILVVLGLLLGALVVVTTVFTCRAPGMRMTRIPLFSWSMVVAGGIWLLTLPVLVALLVLSYVDHRAGGILNGADASGSLYTNALWAIRQPQIYAFVLPALGIVGDIVPTFSRARNELRHVGALALIGLFGVAGVGAWSITSYVSFGSAAIEPQPFSNPVMIVQALIAVLPVLALAGLWADSFRRGRAIGKPVKGSPLLFALAVVPLLLLAVVAGVLAPIERLELHNTLFDDGQATLAIAAGIVAALGGLHYWASKIQGRSLSDLVGMGSAALTLLGGLALAAGQLLAGAFGDGNEVVMGTSTYNLLAAAGATALLVGVALTAISLLTAMRGVRAPADPWEGQTLEWATDSPPAYDNFLEIPPVRSEAPMADLRDGVPASDGAAR